MCSYDASGNVAGVHDPILADMCARSPLGGGISYTHTTGCQNDAQAILKSGDLGLGTATGIAKSVQATLTATSSA